MARVQTRKPAPRTRAVRPKQNRLGNVARGAARTGAQTIRTILIRAFRSQSVYFYRLLGVTLFLVAFGLVMVLSASSVDALKATNNAFSVFGSQFRSAALGLVALTLLSLVPIETLGRNASKFYVAALGLQAFTIFFGKSINGNRNWLSIPLLGTFQPSELLKLAVILHIGYVLSRKADRLDEQATWKQTLLIAVVAMAAVMFGFDLGTMIIMAIAFIGMLYLAGLPKSLLRLIGLVAVLGLPVLLTFGSSSRLGRITAWLNPNAADPNNYNWQSEHGLWAFAAGGIFGSGLGESKMKWSWIPEVENDFIFAVIGEELGLIGAVVVIAMFVFLAIAFLNILKRTDDPFGRFVVGGVMLWIIFQALINIAVVLRLLPVLGVPLPLISAGGSSLLSVLSAIGIVLAVERNNFDSRPRSRVKPVRR